MSLNRLHQRPIPRLDGVEATGGCTRLVVYDLTRDAEDATGARLTRYGSPNRDLEISSHDRNGGAYTDNSTVSVPMTSQ